jgi:hypothetical protein
MMLTETPDSLLTDGATLSVLLGCRHFRRRSVTCSQSNKIPFCCSKRFELLCHKPQK